MARRAPQGSASPDGVVAFAGIDWWYHNRSHSEGQVMVRLARTHTVLWVNSIGMRTPVPGRTEIPFKRYLRKLKSTLRGLRRDPSGMWVLSPLYLPRFTPRALRINGWLLRMQVAMVCRYLKLRRPSAWVTVPTVAPAVLGRRWSRLVFNRSDDFSAFPGVDRDVIVGLEDRLLAGSDTVLYVNHQLRDREQAKVRDAIYLGHGVDYEHFAAAAAARATAPVPAELASRPRPFIGFYGALRENTIDLDLFVAVARAFPAATIVVIGPQNMEIDRLLAEPNVAYLGAIPYADLPPYAAQFDVGLMPWLQNEWIAQCNPIKLKEYMALGFPVASTPFPELAPYRDLVHEGAGPDEFVAAVKRALDEPPESAAARQALVAADSWDGVAQRVGAYLGLG